MEKHKNCDKEENEDIADRDPFLTIIYSIDFIDEPLIGELCGQRSEQVNVAVQEQKSVEHRQDLVLNAGKLSLHSQHHVGNMLQINTEFLF